MGWDFFSAFAHWSKIGIQNVAYEGFFSVARRMIAMGPNMFMFSRAGYDTIHH